jgi:nucleoside-diphosphate-sugar epimerase
MKTLLTGATGVIGRRTVPLLVAHGHQVTAVGRTTEKRAQLERAGATPIELDLFDQQAAERAMAGHDVVINLATHIPPVPSAMRRRAWRENDRIRREASAVLTRAAAAARVARFIQESFAPMYAAAGDAWIDERSPVDPAPYNRSSLDAERHTDGFTALGGAGVVLRFAYFLGPDSTLLPDLLRLLRRGWFGMPGRGDAFLSAVTHDDAAAAVVAALRAPAGTYNVADDEPLRRRDFADALADAFGRKRPRLMPAILSRIGGSIMSLLSRSQRIANRKLREATGWAPAMPSMREGWRRIAAEQSNPI